MSPSPEPTGPSEPTEPTTNPTPNPKKRTYDSISTHSIHKPFRSPLRQNPDAINQTPKWPTFNTTDLKPGHQPAFKTPNTAAHSALHTPSEAQTKPRLHSTTSKSASSAAATSITPPTTHAPHPTLAISRLRTDIDTLQQSLRLLQNHNKKHSHPHRQTQQLPPQDPTSTSQTKANTNIDTELETLISKWRSTARLAAEELYGTAQDKVNQMGGMSGLRAREEANVDRRRMWEEEAREEEAKRLDAELASGSEEDGDEEGAEGGEGGEVLGQAEKKMLKSQAKESKRKAREAREEARSEYDEQAKAEAEKSVEKDGMWAGGGAQGDAFTMDMMLGSMGIDLKVLGWDCDEQRWAE